MWRLDLSWVVVVAVGVSGWLHDSQVLSPIRWSPPAACTVQRSPRNKDTSFVCSDEAQLLGKEKASDVKCGRCCWYAERVQLGR